MVAEYVIYVLMIFIPLGGLLSYLLYKDGVSVKYISLIVFVLLFIILSFPISIERLGTVISLGIYILLLAILTVYLYQSKIEGSGEAVVVPGISAGDDNEAVNIALLEQPRPFETGSYDQPASTLEEALGQLAEEEVDAGVNSEVIVEQQSVNGEGISSAETEAEPREIESVEPEASEPRTVELVEAERDGSQEVESVEAEIAETEEVELAEPEILEPQNIEAVEPEIPEPPEIELVEPEGAGALEVESAEAEVEPPETGSGPALLEEPAVLMPQATELISEDLTIDSSDAMITMGEPALSEPVLPDDSALEQVNDLIDSAFSCRFSNPTQAALYFEEVVKLTSDYELKYLVGMELTEIYKELGAYTKAVTALQSFSVLPGHKSDIINEISRQLEYISLLSSELERLGMGNFPMSRIPRWVRLKIDEQMNPPAV